MTDVLNALGVALTGRYNVVREIGAGGMATVYLARDVKHERDVAVKVLEPELAAVLGVERFLAEIRVTANLQHPNLLPLFDSGEANGLLFYVMPFVEGETLRARLDREKQLPIDDAIHIAVAVANALDYAHSHGVIHRDLKPENILLQHGQPMIADFGIALAVSKAGGQRVTQTGLSLGTPQYMSPEQATGDRAIDNRTDIYSLAAVTYEMLTGEPPHVGSTAQAVIARLMTEKPRPVRAVRDTVATHVERAVDIGLSKLPADRFTRASEFAHALQGQPIRGTLAASHPNEPAASRRAPLWRRVLPRTVAAGAMGILALGSARPAVPGPLSVFSIPLPDSTPQGRPGNRIAVSPDGKRVAYIGHDHGATLIFMRALDDTTVRGIKGTEQARGMSFSPDGESLVFTAEGKF